MAGRPRKINVGDYVRWTTSGRGVTSTRVGRVAAVLEPGQTPDDAQYPIQKLVPEDYRNLDRSVRPVDETSYVINVRGVGFWPKRGTVQKLLKHEVDAAAL